MPNIFLFGCMLIMDIHISVIISASDGSLCLPSPLASPSSPSIHHPSSLSLLGKRFQYSSPLGNGSFAQTLKANDLYHPSRPSVAIKVMNAFYSIIGIEVAYPNPPYPLQEAKRLILLNKEEFNDNCHIVRIITTFQYYEHFCLVFELLHSKPLALPRHPTRMPENINVIRKLACQLLISLCSLRKFGLIHADLKPENILFRNSTHCAMPFHISIKTHRSI